MLVEHPKKELEIELEDLEDSPSTHFIYFTKLIPNQILKRIKYYQFNKHYEDLNGLLDKVFVNCKRTILVAINL